MSQDSRRASGARQRAAGGFTLVELMVTVAVLAILVALAAPSFANIIERNRLTGAANEAVAALQVARMEAIRRGSNTVLCPSTDGASCAGNDWSRVIVFVDDDGDGGVDSGPAEPVLRDVVVPAGSIQVKPSTNVATNDRIRFSADGFVHVGSGGVREGGISLCTEKLPDAGNTRDVVVEVSRISVETRNGTPECAARTD